MEQDNTLAEPAVVTDDVNPVPIPEGTAPPGDESKEQAEKPPKTFSQEEVDALIQKRLLKEERRVHRRVEQQLRDKQQQDAPEPQRETFQNDQAYILAQIDHRAAQKAAEMIEQREKERESRKLMDSFEERAEKASEKYPDFEAVARNPSLPITPHMAEFISLSESGPEIAYHLGKNPSVSARIAQMSPIGAARELARIETELNAPKPKASNAPDPINPVGNRGRASVSSLPSDDDDIETWMKKERARK